MTAGSALSKLSTWIFNQTWVDTLTVNACLPVATVAITLASNRLAGNQWIADKSWRTLAYWSMVLYEALSTCAAVAWVHTLTVDTRLAIRTVVVARTSWWVWQADWNTASV